MSDKNFYEILGVRPDASQAEIRAAYLKLAKQWHPDRNTGNEAEAEWRFKQIAHAYEVLSNADKRAAYDAASQQSSGFESTMDEADAFDLFISVLLDLAFELAENGADQIAIYQALIDMGCPSGTAKTLAQKAHKLGGKSDAGKSSEKSAQSKAESRRGNGGGGETTNATASVPNEPDETFPAGPWSRWFARSLDLLVGATVASPLIGLLVQFMWTLKPLPFPDRIALYLLAIAPLPFIVDAIIVGVFGNSLGKALLKIKVHSKLTVDGVETLQPIYFDEAIQRNFKIWLKGYWFSIPILAAIPQFLAFLKVSDGKQVPWDMGPDYESVTQIDAEDLSGKSIPEKQRYFVLRQKTRWELIVAFVVCVIAAPIAGKVGAELFVGPFPALMANQTVLRPSEMAADAADGVTEPATDASGANAPDVENALFCDSALSIATQYVNKNNVKVDIDQTDCLTEIPFFQNLMTESVNESQNLGEISCPERDVSNFPEEQCYVNHTMRVTHDGPRFVFVENKLLEELGGAHSLMSVSGIVYDKKSLTNIKFEDLFENWNSVRNIIQKRWCKKLEAELKNSFISCPNISEQSILLEKINNKTKIVVSTSDYAFGNYAFGSRSASFDFDKSIKNEVKDYYRDDFN